jgi:hypothetical protein
MVEKYTEEQVINSLRTSLDKNDITQEQFNKAYNYLTNMQQPMQQSVENQSQYPQTTYPQTTYPQTTYPQTTYPQTTYPQTPYPQTTYTQTPYPQTPYPQTPYKTPYKTPVYRGGQVTYTVENVTDKLRLSGLTEDQITEVITALEHTHSMLNFFEGGRRRRTRHKRRKSRSKRRNRSRRRRR